MYSLRFIVRRFTDTVKLCVLLSFLWGSRDHFLLLGLGARVSFLFSLPLLGSGRQRGCGRGRGRGQGARVLWGRRRRGWRRRGRRRRRRCGGGSRYRCGLHHVFFFLNPQVSLELFLLSIKDNTKLSSNSRTCRTRPEDSAFPLFSPPLPLLEWLHGQPRVRGCVILASSSLHPEPSQNNEKYKAKITEQLEICQYLRRTPAERWSSCWKQRAPVITVVAQNGVTSVFTH